LEPAQLDQLLEAVADRVLPGAEMTLEANPESLTGEHLAVFGARGGTRLSLGIQSFDETILARHGRPTRRVHLANARSLVQGWPGGLSLDLICGLEGQTEGGQRWDLEEALDWQPDHLSFYSLTIEPETPLGRRAGGPRAAMPSQDDAERWWLDGRDLLESAGLAQYEVSNFARPGAASVHNSRYWALEPWWGLGPSATSFLPRANQGWEYRTETTSLPAWLAGTGPEVEIPSKLDLTKDRLLAGLRRTEGVSDSPWMDIIPETLGLWSGKLEQKAHRLFLTREAFPFLDAFLRDAFTELDGRPEFR